MFELFVVALLQFANLSGNASTTSSIGSSGWDVDAKQNTTTSSIGSSGWDVD